MLLLSFCVLWPIKLLRNLIKYNKIWIFLNHTSGIDYLKLEKQ
jgi:hypothetical protein